MIAEPSPPPGAGYTPPDTPANAPSNSHKKRKRGAPPPPPPQAPGTPGTPEETDVISIKSDLSGRPRLEYARGPTFVPIPDSDLYRTEFIPMNHIGFRYTPAGIHPTNHLLPLRTIAYRPPIFRAAFEDRSPYIGISQDGLILEGFGGFRTARCTAPMREGKWYMEVEVIRGGGDNGAHVRLGWSRRETLLNGPIGLDGYSYAYRDKTGDKVTVARPRPYGKPFKTGDIIGMYISLPPRRPADPNDEHDPAHLKRVRIPIDYKGQEVFEALEYKPRPEMSALMDPFAAAKAAAASKPTKQANDRAPDKRAGRAPGGSRVPAPPQMRPLPRLHGAHIAFFVNGESQGVAFEDIYDFLPLRAAASERRGPRRRPPREGQKEHRLNAHDDGTLGYYASVSLYGPARVRLNPGPDFKYPPPDDVDTLLFTRHAPLVAAPNAGRAWRPASERYDEFMAEQRALDKQEEIEGAAALAEFQKEAAREAAAAEKKRARREADAARRRAQKVTQHARASTSVQPSPLRHATAYPEGDQDATPTVDAGMVPKRVRMEDILDDPSPFVRKPSHSRSPDIGFAQHTTELAVPTPKIAESAYAAIMSHPREVPYERQTSYQPNQTQEHQHRDIQMQDVDMQEVEDELRGGTPGSDIQSTPGSPVQSQGTPGSPLQSTPASPSQSAPASPTPFDHARTEDGHATDHEGHATDHEGLATDHEGNATDHEGHATEDDMPDEYNFQIGREGEDPDEEEFEGAFEGAAGDGAEREYETDEGDDDEGHGYGAEQTATPEGYSSDSGQSEA